MRSRIPPRLLLVVAVVLLMLATEAMAAASSQASKTASPTKNSSASKTASGTTTGTTTGTSTSTSTKTSSSSSAKSTSSKDYSIPTPQIPNTKDAPFMQTSKYPEGFIFIIVGSVIGLALACVILWRVLVAMSLNRSNRLSNAAAIGRSRSRGQPRPSTSRAHLLSHNGSTTAVAGGRDRRSRGGFDKPYRDVSPGGLSMNMSMSSIPSQAKRASTLSLPRRGAAPGPSPGLPTASTTAAASGSSMALSSVLGGSGPPSALFYSPTAGAPPPAPTTMIAPPNKDDKTDKTDKRASKRISKIDGKNENRKSAYLPAGYYAAASANSGNHAAAARGSLRHHSRLGAQGARTSIYNDAPPPPPPHRSSLGIGGSSSTLGLGSSLGLGALGLGGGSRTGSDLGSIGGGMSSTLGVGAPSGLGINEPLSMLSSNAATTGTDGIFSSSTSLGLDEHGYELGSGGGKKNRASVAASSSSGPGTRASARLSAGPDVRASMGSAGGPRTSAYMGDMNAKRASRTSTYLGDPETSSRRDARREERRRSALGR